MTTVMIIIFILFMLTSLPIGYSLISASAIALVWVAGLPDSIVMLRFFQPTQNFVMIAIPFFILSGALMMSGQLGEKLIGFATRIVGRYRGGLGQVNVVGSVLFGGVSGSAVADASAMGGMMIPWMRREGYPAGFSAAITASSSIIAVLVPPSIPLIIYATVSNESVADLFTAGVLPALMLAAGLMVTCWIIAKKRDFPILKANSDQLPFIKVLKAALPAISLPVLIVVMLRFGFATPTEVSVLATAYALLLRLIYYRDLTWNGMVTIMTATMITTGVVMLVIAASNLVSFVMAFENVPTMVAEWAMRTFSHPWQTIILMNLVMLIVGMFIDLSAAMLLLAPIFVVLSSSIGLDLTQLGVMMTINLGIGLFTPPVGTTLFISSAIARVSVGKVAREMWPFYLVVMVTLGLIAFVPQFTIY